MKGDLRRPISIVTLYNLRSCSPSLRRTRYYGLDRVRGLVSKRTKINNEYFLGRGVQGLGFVYS